MPAKNEKRGKIGNRNKKFPILEDVKKINKYVKRTYETNPATVPLRPLFVFITIKFKT